MDFSVNLNFLKSKTTKLPLAKLNKKKYITFCQLIFVYSGNIHILRNVLVSKKMFNVVAFDESNDLNELNELNVLIDLKNTKTK